MTGLLAPVLFLVSALQGTDAQVMPLLLRVLRGTAWPGEEPGHLIVAYNLGAAFGPLLVTWILPLASPRRLVVAALVVHGASNAVLATFPEFPVALLLRMLTGAASGVLSYAQLGAAVRAGGSAVTAMTAGSLVAMVAGMPLASFLVDRFGVAPLFAGLATVAAAALAGSLAAIPRSEPATSGPPRNFAQLLLQRPLRAVLASSLLIAAAVGGPTTILPDVLQGGDGASAPLTTVGLVYLAGGLGPLLAIACARPLRHRLSNRALAIAGALALAPALLVLPLAATTVFAITPLLVTALWIETLRRAALQHHVATLAAPQDLARFLGLRGVLVQLALATGNELALLLRSHSGFPLACLVASSLALASSLLIPRPPADLASDPRSAGNAPTDS